MGKRSHEVAPVEQGKVMRLSKELFGLRRSSLLWQQKLTNQLKSFCFFYVDDIVLAFKKEQNAEVKRTVDSLSITLTIDMLGELKWFLILHVIRVRSSRTSWLSQKAYIQKIRNKLAPIDENCRPISTPIEATEFLPAHEDEVRFLSPTRRDAVP